MNGQRILVTGGAGFIGSNLANHLAERNEVIVVDDESLGTADHLEPSISFNRQSVLEDGLPTDVDVIFHLAARSSYAMHEDDPCEGVRVNVEGFVNTVEQAIEDGCDRVVYASSSSVYGSHETPQPVDTPVSASSAYEASKLARERYAEYFANHYGIDTVGLRLYSVYQGFGGAERHKGGYANIIAQFAESMANNEAPLLYGDGTQTRDFVYIDDVVRSFVRAADSAPAGVYNVGTGEAHSFNTIVQLINDSLGTTIDPAYVDNPIPTDVYVHDTCAEHTRFANATGWTPTIDIAEGIDRVCRPYLEATNRV